MPTEACGGALRLTRRNLGPGSAGCPTEAAHGFTVLLGATDKSVGALLLVVVVVPEWAQLGCPSSSPVSRSLDVAAAASLPECSQLGQAHAVLAVPGQACQDHVVPLRMDDDAVDPGQDGVIPTPALDGQAASQPEQEAECQCSKRLH